MWTDLSLVVPEEGIDLCFRAIGREIAQFTEHQAHFKPGHNYTVHLVADLERNFAPVEPKDPFNDPFIDDWEPKFPDNWEV